MHFGNSGCACVDFFLATRVCSYGYSSQLTRSLPAGGEAAQHETFVSTLLGYEQRIKLRKLRFLDWCPAKACSPIYDEKNLNEF